MKLGIHIVTGYLGAGKSTFINLLLRQKEFERTAILVNEFGAIGIDQLVIDNSSDDVIELAGGCLCCAFRGEFIDKLIDLLSSRSDQIDRVIIETSGLADPAPVLQSILSHWQLSQIASIGTTVCLIDGTEDFEKVLQYKEARAQLAIADAVIVTKSQTNSKERKAQLERYAAHKPIHFEPLKIDDISQNFLADQKMSAFRAHAMPSKASLRNTHQADYQTTILTSQRALKRIDLEMFFELLVTKYSEKLLRLKGLAFIKEHPDKPLLLQAVGSVFAEPKILNDWQNKAPQTQLVVITDGIESSEISSVFNTISQQQSIDEADKDALFSNPLAGPTMGQFKPH